VQLGVFLILFGAFLTAAGVSVYHYLQDEPLLLDLIVPPIFTIYLFTVMIYLLKFPDKIAVVIRPSIFMAILALCVPAWYYSLIAFGASDVNLITIMPPITPMLFPVALAIVVFLTPRLAMNTFLLTWIAFGAPIAAYLVTHQEEMLSPRGIEILVTLGPIMFSVFTLLLASLSLKKEVLQLHDQKSDLKLLSEQDALTALLNRRAGEAMLKKATQVVDSPFGVILFDIDHFKSVNDEHGHDVGDKTLQEIVLRCQTRVRSHDYFIRWGGEEFMLIMFDVGLEETSALADELRVLICAEALSTGLLSSASFGVTIKHDLDDKDSIFKRADEALYEAKNTGRNKVVNKLA
jgi:diguanylate cyclase (GGDEF)-like protein